MNDETNAAKSALRTLSRQRQNWASFTNRKTIVTGALGLVVLAVAGAGIWYATTAKKTPEAATSAKGERKVLYWTDPMIPGFKSDKPGKSPMNMDMVPVYEDEAGAGGAPIVTIRPEIVNNLGVRTYQVARGGVSQTLVAQGYLFREGGRVLALVDIFDRDTDWVRPGLAAEVRVADLPGKTWGGAVERVEPDVDIGARSFKVRVSLHKPNAALKPNMFAEVTIKSSAPDGQGVAVPREALIRTGFRTAVVLALGDGRFQPVEVVAGRESGDWVEIAQGVKEGDTVVVSGQFLIDSEANVRASFRRLEPTDALPAPQHDKH